MDLFHEKFAIGKYEIFCSHFKCVIGIYPIYNLEFLMVLTSQVEGKLLPRLRLPMRLESPRNTSMSTMMTLLWNHHLWTLMTPTIRTPCSRLETLLDFLPREFSQLPLLLLLVSLQLLLLQDSSPRVKSSLTGSLRDSTSSFNLKAVPNRNTTKQFFPFEYLFWIDIYLFTQYTFK